MDAPTRIRSLSDAGALELHFGDGGAYRLPFHFLRGQCPCAGCVDEFTGVRTLDVSSIPLTIRPEKVSLVGNYALKIEWNDAHNTGLYTWDYLHKLCAADEVEVVQTPDASEAD